MPWPVQDAPVRRPGPFDPNYPTSRNTVVLGAQRPIAPAQPVQPPRSTPAAVHNEQSPWFAASQGVVSNAWASDPNSLTAANLGQHNRQQEQEELQKQQHTPGGTAVAAQADPPVKPAAVPEPAPAAEVQPPKPRRKPSANTVPVKTAAVPAAPISPPSPPHASPAEGKLAWAVDEDKKAKPSGTALGLREIQEMEAKKLDAKKAAERERERAARAAAVTTSPSSEEVQTISWGLPTSQVSGRTAALGAKESSGLSPASQSSTPAPVWTGATKAPVVKKTMKEIQEEEEKRKKMAKEKETVASAARRAYAESTNKARLSV